MAAADKKSMLITGAAGGLGSALAQLAARSGWHVVMLDSNKRGLERCYDAIVSAGGIEPFLMVMDLARIGPDDCGQLAEALEEQLGGLDALVHCAVSFQGLQPLDIIEPQTWLQQIQVNLNAPWLLSNALLPLLKQRTASSLVFLLDEEAEARALWGAYATSKSGLRSLAAQFNAELKNSAVSVLAIDPGAMRTTLRSSVYHSENPQNVVAPDVRATQILSILDGDKDRQFLSRLAGSSH